MLHSILLLTHPELFCQYWANSYPPCYFARLTWRTIGHIKVGRTRAYGGEMVKKTWDHEWYTDEFLQSPKVTARLEHDGDVAYVVKHAPDAVSELGIDPRMLGGPIGRLAKRLCIVPGCAFDFVRLPINAAILGVFRKSFSKVSSADCRIRDVSVQDDFAVARDGHKIPTRIYKRNDGRCGICLYFMHGGAFIGGTLDPYDECWKMFASKFGVTVISVDYRLLPENPYPTSYNDCLDALCYIYEHAEAYAIDRDRIFVCGDSAGGNLAQACTNAAEGASMVRGQLLLYPTLNLFCIEGKYYKKGIDDFTFEPTQKLLSKGVVRQMQALVRFDIEKIGMVRPDRLNNPYSFGVTCDTPTFISVGALDYLRKDAFGWAHKLTDAGVEVKMVVYNGLGHGYINATGVFPQAEDVIDEMGTFVLGHSQ